MKHLIKTGGWVLLVLLIANKGIAQGLLKDTAINVAAIAATPTSSPSQNVLTAESLVSGNAKDVLTSFFQLAFDKITGPDKEINFNSNPFALLLKSNPDLALDANYYKYRALRKLNFNFGIKLDSSYRFNGFNSGLTFALINKRDTATSAFLFHALEHDRFSIEIIKLHEALVAYASTIADTAKRRRFHNGIRQFLRTDIDFVALDTAVRSKTKEIIDADSATYPTIHNLMQHGKFSSVVATNNEIRQGLADQVKHAALWTVSLNDTTYKDQFFFSNIVLKTQFVKGFGKMKPGMNWEFDVQAAMNFLDDSLSVGRDLKRSFLSFEPGVNWVARSKSNDQSFVECKLSAAYFHHFNTLYAEEKRDEFTFNSTIRVRIIADIWLPLEVKYDPQTGNVFGFLSVKANFSSLGSLF
jgi:hypothetical protein